VLKILAILTLHFCLLALYDFIEISKEKRNFGLNECLAKFQNYRAIAHKFEEKFYFFSMLASSYFY